MLISQAAQSLHLQCLEMHDQVLDDEQRRNSMFPTDNALVEDPVALLAYEASLRPWTPEEKRIFMDKYLAYPKV